MIGSSIQIAAYEASPKKWPCRVVKFDYDSNVTLHFEGFYIVSIMGKNKPNLIRLRTKFSLDNIAKTGCEFLKPVMKSDLLSFNSIS